MNLFPIWKRINGYLPENLNNKMKITFKNLALFAGILFMMGSAACAQKGKKNKDKAPEMVTEMDSVSYIFGASLGMNIRQSEIEDVSLDQLFQGIKDALESDSSMAISMEDGNNYVRAFMGKQQAELAAKAVGKADAYMKEKAAAGGLESTESGMLYEVVTEGTGALPDAADKVKVHYEGKTTDGVVFDSSYERGEPAEFPLTRVIPGWTEILQLMPIGSTWIVTIPPAMAYGDRGSPPKIGPNEVLIFKIELIDITTGK